MSWDDLRWTINSECRARTDSRFRFRVSSPIHGVCHTLIGDSISSWLPGFLVHSPAMVTALVFLTKVMPIHRRTWPGGQEVSSFGESPSLSLDEMVHNKPGYREASSRYLY